MKYFVRTSGVQSWIEISKQRYYNLRRRKNCSCSSEYVYGVCVAKFIVVSTLEDLRYVS